MRKIIFLFGIFLPIFGFCGGIDPYIPLQTRQIDANKMMQDSERMSQIMQSNNIEREKSRIYKEGDGDPEVMLELAKKSKMARLIVPYFQEQAYQQQVYELNMLKLKQEMEKAKEKDAQKQNNE
ncbi:hypothetical protein FY048_01635 [Acinetobacter sp. 1124_18A]|uniref:hypothetical protein n=1 Tax=Acinetobacter sp. 1124_18A TaxID=2605958 RepID=UPI00405A0F04